MTKSTRVLVLVLISGLFSGCGDDGGGDAPLDAGPLPTDQCVNANDTPIIDALYADGGPGLSLDSYVQPCVSMPGADCYAQIFDTSATDEEISTCISNCVSTTPVAGVSGECLICFADTTRCAADQCLLPCIGGDMVMCSSCLQTNCFPALWDCTGEPPR